MFKLQPIKQDKDDKGLSDRGIEIRITRPDGEEYVKYIWLRKDLGITKKMMENDAFVMLVQAIEMEISDPIPMPDKPVIIQLNAKERNENK